MATPEPPPGHLPEWRLSYWAPQIVVLVAIGIDFALPHRIIPLHPSWLLPGLEAVLVVGLMLISPHPRMRHSSLRRFLAIGLTAVVSAVNIVSLGMLCRLLLQPGHQHPINNGGALIAAGAGLWLTNVLLFGLWYWELDRGGPLARRFGPAGAPDFLFPQMTDASWAPEHWEPGLIDYVYVSLTNATAFSPTDTMPLTPMAKSLMSAQAVVSLVTVGLVVARAVNILA
jgi:uncharacterized membrane protein